MLGDTTLFKDCNGVAGLETFANCVALKGSWPLATAGKLTCDPSLSTCNQTKVEKLNGQEVTVKVEVPGGLTTPPEPTPISSDCAYTWVERSPTWVQVGDTITYDVHVLNCSSSGSTKRLRRVVVLLPPAYNYTCPTHPCTNPVSTLFTGWPGAAVKEPTEARCTGFNLPYPGCKANDNSLLLIWPFGNGIFSGSTDVTLTGGQEKELQFKVSISPTADAGVYYVDVSVCYFAASVSACNTEVSGDPLKKVAPVVAGMFNIKGKGKGYAFGASAKLDSGGSSLISQSPQ
ncbi:MAG: hypothetical protein V1724_03900 [Chloroflexota bacterium]